MEINYCTKIIHKTVKHHLLRTDTENKAGTKSLLLQFYFKNIDIKIIAQHVWYVNFITVKFLY